MQYVIKWKSKITDKTGGGTTKMELSTASREVDKLNREFPEVEHWYEEAK